MAQAAWNVGSQLNTARQHMAQGRLDEAEKILTHLKAVTAPHPVLFEYLGFIAIRRKDLPKAVRHYKKAVKLDPNCAQLKMKLAEMSLAIGQEAEAVRLARSVHRKDARNVAALNLLGMMAGQSGSPIEARDFFTAAVTVDPDNIHAWQGLGACRLELSEWQNALDALLRANTLCPDHRPTLNAIGRAQTSLGKPELAIGVLQRAQSLASSTDEYCETTVYLVESYLRAQQLDAALEAVHQLEQRDPDHTRGRALHASILHEQGQHEQALSLITSRQDDKDATDADWFPRYLAPQCLLALEQHDEAAAAFSIANHQQTMVFERLGTDKNVYVRFVQEAIKLFSQTEEPRTDPHTSPDAGKGLAFINGFPRSGTTLIDAVLRNHSAIAIAEESLAAHSCLQEAGRLLPDGLTHFSALTTDME
ncbi:MAG: tetratricopeptide repeat protein, partial [Pseudomonadota bacterium]